MPDAGTEVMLTVVLVGVGLLAADHFLELTSCWELVQTTLISLLSELDAVVTPLLQIGRLRHREI